MKYNMKKGYYSIKEVSEIVGLKPYVLRYWETEFKEISPIKNNAGVRRYEDKDIDVILVIRDLLHVKKYKITGAKSFLKENDVSMLISDTKNNTDYKMLEKLKKVQQKIADLISYLDED